ncbi:MAG: winged helix-turn-helix transcriptional regulator [Gaiellaceae bacterium]
MTSPRRYDQYCPVCHALELVGERWALLIVRELLKGPKRYTDLLEGMPRVGTNILAARLRELEGGGIVQKRKLPPPAASTVYELTEYGRELEEPLYALARWGARSLPPPVDGEDFDPDWGLNAFAALLDPQAARGLAATYVVRVADDVYTVRLEDGTAHVEVGAADDADLDFATDRETFFGLASGELDPRVALSGGDVTIEAGKQADLERFFSVFNFSQRARVAV